MGAAVVALSIAAVVPGVPARAEPTIPELVEVADMANLSPSPGGSKVAFRVERPSIERNSYDLDWYVADLDTGAVRRVAGGGAPIYGDAGPLEAERVVWSPDERHFYHRALIDGAIGLWRSAVDGSGSSAVVVADADVENLSAGSDGRSLTYELGPSRDSIERAERKEYDDGILVDYTVDLGQALYRGGSVHGRLASQRLTGRWYARDGLLWRSPRDRYRLDLSSLETHKGERFAVPAAAPLAPAAEAMLELLEPGRPIARVVGTDEGTQLTATTSDRTSACLAADCAKDIAWLAWRPGTDELAFTTADDFHRQTLHLWDIRSGRVREVTQTDGLLSGSRDGSVPCAITRIAAVCVSAGAVTPPRLVRIDLATGASTTLLDPNTALRSRSAPRLERLTWALGDGRSARGLLLRPPADAAVPLFVSYYYCPGYLRGGTGDEFPFAPLVDAGIAVVCIDMVATPSNDAVDRYGTAQASVESLVQSLSRRGLIDPKRVGMGGFSAGSEATMWTAMNSGLLAAAAIASPQYEPSAYWREALPGRDYPTVLREFIGLGAPDETPERWKQVSPALNTARIEAPLLMQMPETEARAAAELHARLANSTTPVELYAFPDEGHVKMQPRHRAAVYRRNLDWFRYWLQDYRDPDPAKAGQYRRWDAMRQRREEAHGSNARSQDSAEHKSSSRM